MSRLIKYIYMYKKRITDKELLKGLEMLNVEMDRRLNNDKTDMETKKSEKKTDRI